MPGPFNDQEATTGFDMGDAYRRASGNAPVKAKDLKTAYRPYNNTGKPLRVGRKNQSDAKLYKLATREVLDWYKAHKQPPKKKRRPSSGGGQAVRRGAQQEQSRPRSGGSAGARGARLPDTAMPAPGSARVTRATKLPDIKPRRRVRARQSATSSRAITRPAGRGFTQYGV